MNDQTPEKPSLESLNKQLDALKKSQGSEEKKLAPTGDAAKAAIDFASASAVGALLGYGSDHYFGTSPWGIIVGLLLGVLAGVKMMLEAEKRRARKAEKEKETT
jgi:ATP synthase protein I